MTALLDILREGALLTRARLQLWAIAVLIGFAAGLLALALSAHGLTDFQGRPLGTDFSSFYAAAQLAGHGASPYDQTALHRVQQQIFGPDTGYFSFAYPPVFLLLIEPLGRLPYLLALLLWEGAGLALYLAGMARLKRTFAPALDDNRLFWLLALGFTATFVNLTHGQNGFLIAGLFAFALSFLDERPWLAGVFFGLIICKPQLGLLIPIALAAGGRWRSFAAATATIALLCLASFARYGADAWHGFLAATTFSRIAILDQGAVGFQKMASVFAWLRLWGAPAGLAYAAQAVAALGAAGATAWLWRSSVSLRVKAAGLLFATILATPFALDYDLMILAPAIALLAFEGLVEEFPPFQRTLLAVLWFAPIATRTLAGYAHVPFAAIAIVIALALLIASEAARRRTDAALALS